MASLTRAWALASTIARLSATSLVLATIGCHVLLGTGPLQPARAIVIAHRGASAVAPEHTTAAYDRAIQLGADYIELDVQRTKDGVLVVIHDATLDRTARGMSADCTGRVAERTTAQIESCDAGSWFNAAYPPLARAEFVALDPTFPLIQLVSATSPSAIIAQLPEVRAYAAGIGVRKDDVTPALIQSAHAACLLVHPYTVNVEHEMLSLLEMGVDGIFTDRPDELRDALAGAPDRPAGESGCVVVAR